MTIPATAFDPPLEACPLCASKDIAEYDRDYRGARIARCGACGVRFMNPQYTDAYLAEYYATYIQEELEALQGRLLEMGGLAEERVRASIQGLVSRDVAVIDSVVAGDEPVNRLHIDVDNRSFRLLALYQPMATDLRAIVAAVKINSDLERVGDLGKNIAKRVVAATDTQQPVRLFRGIEALAELALTQLKDVLDAYASRSVERIGIVRNRDDQIDAMYTSLFRELLTYMMEDPRSITPCTHLLFCAKNIERIGDHATNIAETVFYMIEGQQILDKRPKGDMTTFATTVPGN